MDIQTIIVSIILLSALIYVGTLIAGKIKAFTPKSECGTDCGCGTNNKAL